MDPDRRRLLADTVALGLAAGFPAAASAATASAGATSLATTTVATTTVATGPGPGAVIRKTIPSTGETLAAIGVGTARRYQGASGEEQLAPLRQSLQAFLDLGGTVVDTAPSYGDAETVVGSLLAGINPDKPVFLATKLGATGRAAGLAQIEQSFRLLRRERLDLIAVHNLQDIATQLPLLHELKQAGRIRHVGATTSSDRQYEAFEAMMKRETLDLIQVDFALDNRRAGERLLPLAKDRNMGVMINLPFGRGRLFDATQGRPLPSWASEFDCRSWAQFFLKYIISHEAVTCAIPGMAKPEYVIDNMAAATGRLPDAATRKRMESFIDAL
jgi:aryl-alcohol dehydrogenase-like predicted oxidoreductase